MKDKRWIPSTRKPPHLPGEHHSADVLIRMKAYQPDDHGICIGHVSLGHWRPNGGNGNFDNEVIEWMPLPK